MLRSRAADRAEAKRSGIVPTDKIAVRMSSNDALKWGEMAALIPFAGLKRGAPATEEAEDGGEEEDEYSVKGCRLGASEIFNCPPEKRLHLSYFMGVLRDIKKKNKPDIIAFAAEVNGLTLF